MLSPASSSSCVPTPWTRPSSNTTMRSASMTLAMRWAMMSTVVLGIRAMCSRILASVAISTALVESSKMSTRGCLSSVRAMHRRCFWPPETPAPPWPNSPSSPPMRSRNSSTHAARQAARSSSSDACGLPHCRFSRTVPVNSTFFCSTIPTASRKVAKS